MGGFKGRPVPAEYKRVHVGIGSVVLATGNDDVPRPPACWRLEGDHITGTSGREELQLKRRQANVTECELE